MVGKILKEVGIALLLCLAIILLLGVLLYEFIPNNKVLPEKVAYVTPENVKEEINKSEGVDESSVVLTYQIDANDLNNYKRINDYVPGKPNPFSSYKSSTSGNVQNSGSGNSNSGTGSSIDTSNGTRTETNPDGTVTIYENESPYSNNKGTK